MNTQTLTSPRAYKRVGVGLLVVLGLVVAVVLSATPSNQAKNPLTQATWINRIERGEVTQIRRASHYTYFRLKTAADEKWVVVMEPAPAATNIKVKLYATINDFHSPRLNTTFSTLYFGSIEATKEQQQ